MAGRRVKRRGAALAVMLCCLAGGAGATDVPHPSLDGMEPAVAGQVRSLVSALEAASEEEAPARAQRFAELGALYHSLDFLDAALACYRSAESLAPGDGRWPYMQGVLHADAGRVDAAREALLRAMAVQPSLNRGWVRLGRLALDAGDAERALQDFQRALATMPESAAALAGAGQALLELDRPGEAAEHLERALRIEPRANRLHYPLAMAYRALDDNTRMRSHLEQVGAVGVTVDDPVAEFMASRAAGSRIHVQQGNQAYRAGDYRAAAEAFARATAAAPDDATAWVNQGAAQAALDRNPDARRSFQRALELAPDNLTALENLVALLTAAGEKRAALDFLEKHLPAASDEAKLIHARAVLYRELGRAGDAVADYRRLTELDAGSERAWRGLVAASVEAGRLERVPALLDEADGALEDPVSFRRDLVDSLVTAHRGDPAEAALAQRVAGELYARERGAGHALRVVRGLLLGEDGCAEARRWLEEQLGRDDLAPDLRAGLRDMRTRLDELPRCKSAAGD